jgi:hypothetical protein
MSLHRLDLKRLHQKIQGKNLITALAVAGILGFGTLGTTLAANISLNSGQNVEFGQGVASTTSCDNSIVITPESTFINSGQDGDFYFSSLSVTDISTACYGKTFEIKAYKNGQGSPLNLYQTNGTDTYSELQVYDNYGSFVLINAGLLSDDISDVANAFTINFSTTGPPPSVAVAIARDVDRITIQSTESTPPGSMQFSNNLIRYDSNSEFVLGYNDFTIETWAKISNDNGAIYDTGESVNDPGGFAFWIEGGNLKYRINGYSLGTGYDIEYSLSGLRGEWHHYALTRTAGIIRMFVDGQLVASSFDNPGNPDGLTTTNLIELTRDDPAIGGLIGFNGYRLDGNISSLRVVKGSALYIGNFTPPTRFVDVPGALLVLHSEDEGSLFTDYSSYHWSPSNQSSLPQWSDSHP